MSSAKLSDVAKEAKVAISTASIVLSESAQLGEIALATQERIRAVARRLKYRTNAGARQIHMRRTGSVALLQSSAMDRAVLSSQLLYGISMELQRVNQSLRFIQLDDEDLMKKEPRFLRQKDVDGVLVNYGVQMPRGLFDFISHYEIPSVFINSRKSANSIWFDQLSATKLAVKRFAGLGHRRIAFLYYTGSYDHYGVRDVVKGFVASMEELGLQPRILDNTVPRSGRLDAGKKLLSEKMHPTAILTASPSSAIPLVQAAGQLGLMLPGDLSVCTFGNDQETSLVFPQPSYIALPWREAGRAAVRMLLKKIENHGKDIRSERLGCELSEGGGTIGPA